MMWYPPSTMPCEGRILVYLEEEAGWTRVHIATRRRVQNGTITVVGGHFDYDMPEIVAWSFPPDEPTPEELEFIKKFDVARKP